MEAFELRTEVPTQTFDYELSSPELFSSQDLNLLLLGNHHKRVLVFGKDEMHRETLESLILEINPRTEIDWASNMGEAITYINQAICCENKKRYDLIISDIAYGKKTRSLDFYRLCEKALPNVRRVLILPRLGDDFSDSKDYLLKPIDSDQFHKRVAPVLAA